MRRLAFAIALVVSLAATAWADFDDGVAAYDRGDYATALQEFSALAEQGDPDAQSILAYMYGRGEGVPQDYVAAHMWSNLAGAQGNIGAVVVRDSVAEEMTAAQIAQAQRLAREWLARRPTKQ